MSLKCTIVRSDRNFDFWFSYSDFHLKQLCESYGLPSTGTKKEKAARLCFAYEMGYEPIHSPKLVDEIRRKEIFEKLDRRPFAIPDPATLQEWRDDEDALAKLPLIDRQDIISYHSREPVAAPSDFRGLNEYVNTVAFGLWKNQHVRNVMVYSTDNVPWILAKATCLSSMRKHSYGLWIAFSRDSGGIETAYCECISGLPGYCKHIFAFLFELEFLTGSGQIRPTCTDLPCAWNQPGGSDSDVELAESRLVIDVDWSRSEADRLPTSHVNSKEKREYMACGSVEEDDVKDLLKSIAAERPRSAAIILKNSQLFNKEVRPISGIIDEWRFKIGIPLNIKRKRCLEAIRDYFTLERIQKIQEITVGQWKQSTWGYHRNLRLTASICKSINNAVKRWREEFLNCQGDKEAILNRLLPVYRLNDLKGIRVIRTAPSTISSVAREHDEDGTTGQIRQKSRIDPRDYGRINEPNACAAYEKYHRDEGCDDLVIESRGLVVSSEFPFLGASPDAVAKCARHGERLVEFKCPASCEGSSVFKAPYMDENRKCIKRYDYDEQIMMQMALCGIHECELFIWSPIDFYCEVFKFSEEAWSEIESNLVWYYDNVVLEKLLSA